MHMATGGEYSLEWVESKLGKDSAAQLIRALHIMLNDGSTWRLRVADEAASVQYLQVSNIHATVAGENARGTTIVSFAPELLSKITSARSLSDAQLAALFGRPEPSGSRAPALASPAAELFHGCITGRPPAVESPAESKGDIKSPSETKVDRDVPSLAIPMNVCVIVLLGIGGLKRGPPFGVPFSDRSSPSAKSLPPANKSLHSQNQRSASLARRSSLARRPRSARRPRRRP